MIGAIIFLTIILSFVVVTSFGTSLQISRLKREMEEINKEMYEFKIVHNKNVTLLDSKIEEFKKQWSENYSPEDLERLSAGLPSQEVLTTSEAEHDGYDVLGADDEDIQAVLTDIKQRQ